MPQSNVKRKLYTKAWRDNNKEKLAVDNKTRRKLIRDKVLAHYGGKCELCSSPDQEVLTIDHIWDNGAQHRKTVPAAQIYSWLIKNHFPPGFRLLCHNCNHKAHQAHRESGIPPIAMQTLQREISRWANLQFPTRDAGSVLTKLKEELSEWAGEPDNASELADCMILILDWCEIRGVDMQDAINKKMGVNLERKWIFDPTNRVWHHDQKVIK